MYPNPQVASFIDDHFVPVRVHVREQADRFKALGDRFGVQWTPTILVIDPSGQVRHRIEGFLPLEDFLAQLALGVAHAAFARGDFSGAERQFRDVVTRFPNSDAAPEALYWAGVSRYKATGDASALAATAEEFSRRFSDTSWAKKASIWRQPATR